MFAPRTRPLATIALAWVLSPGCASPSEPAPRTDAGPDATAPDGEADGATREDSGTTEARDGAVADASDASDAGPASCAQQDCSGHGLCTDSATGPLCACDEGFTGPSCRDPGPDYRRRTLLVPGMADPDVLKESDDLFYLTGTARNAAVIPLFETKDLLTFRELPAYDPTALDPAHDYCSLWAPDLTKYEGAYDLYFSAHRVAQGAACPPPSGQEVTTFHARAATLDGFGVPTLLDEGEGLPQSRIESGCGGAPCERTVRIDAAAFEDGNERWFFYVWFTGGNNVASYRFGAPETLIQHVGPARFTLPDYEERINEAPDVFRRGDKLYFFFSGGFFNSQYAMYYIMADDVPSLTRARNVRRHSEPVRAASGRFLETHGHNSIVERRGAFFNVFHQGEFNAAGNFTGRSTHKQRISFHEDGSIAALNFVDLAWSRVTGAVYSLDLIRRDGTVIGPCLRDTRLGSDTQVRFHGVCPDAGDAQAPLDDVASFRLYHSTDGTWSGERSVTAAYAGEDQLFITVPGGTTSQVTMHWNELATDMEYSLDVQRADGTWLAPCVAAGTLKRGIRHDFDGRCGSTTVEPSDVRGFRVCAAAGGQWQNARCGTTSYDGASGFARVSIPE